jgi:hypothetical protein
LESPFLGIAALDHLGWLGSGKKPVYLDFGFFACADFLLQHKVQVYSTFLSSASVLRDRLSCY